MYCLDGSVVCDRVATVRHQISNSNCDVAVIYRRLTGELLVYRSGVSNRRLKTCYGAKGLLLAVVDGHRRE